MQRLLTSSEQWTSFQEYRGLWLGWIFSFRGLGLRVVGLRISEASGLVSWGLRGLSAALVCLSDTMVPI